MIDRVVMDDYDAGFMDAVKLIEKKLDTIIEDCEDGQDINILQEVKRKLFQE